MNSALELLKTTHARGVLSLLVFCVSCEEKVNEDVDAEMQVVEKKAPALAQEGEAPAAPVEPPPWATRVSPEGAFPCEVDQVLAQSCRRCHWEPQENDAPFPLVKHEDTQRDRSGKPIFKLMEQMVSADLMPPLDEPVEPKVTPLTPDQKKILLDWLAVGAPKYEGECP